MKNQMCFAVYHCATFLGFVHAFTEAQAWVFVKKWALSHGYRNQYFDNELCLNLNANCSLHPKDKYLGEAKGSKRSIFHDEEAVMAKQQRHLDRYKVD